MRKNYFFKQILIALFALFIGGYAVAQQCSVPLYSDLMNSGTSKEVAYTSYTGGGAFDAYWTGTSTTLLPITKYNPDSTGGVWSVVEGPFAWGQSSQNINYLQINGPGPENANVYFTGTISVTSSACFYFVGWNSNNTFDVLDSYNSSEYYPFQINCSGLHYFKYFLIVKGGGTRYIKMQISKTPQLLHLAPAQNQDDEGPKLVNLTELFTPVVGETGPESFPFLFQATAAWGDFNNDGYLDVLVAGVYVKAHELDDLGNPIPNIDENGDTIPISYNDDGSLKDDWIKSTKLYKNNGDGTFTNVPCSLPNFDQGGIAWLDYNNDGNLDVFIAGSTQDGSMFSGLWKNLGPEGNYAFEEAFPGEFTYFRTNKPNDSGKIIAVGDFDNDGWVDIAVQGWAGDRRITYLYKNLEGEDFMRVENPVNGTAPFVQVNGGTLHWGDFNNDGYLDLLVVGYIDEGATDFDGNGYDKTLFYDRRTTRDNCNGTCISGAGVLYLNNGDGTFKMPTSQQIFPYGESGSADPCDFNNDGYLDFYVTGYSWWEDEDMNDVSWNIGLFENKHDGTFERHLATDAGLSQTQDSSHSWGDINNDGSEDVIVTDAHPVAAFLNNFGVGTFNRMDIPFEKADESGFEGLEVRGGMVCMVDVNNRGALDIFMNGYDDRNVRSHLFRNDLDDAEGIPAVNQPPSVPTNLKATVDADGMTTFTWDASTDDLTPQAAIRYNLYVKQGDVIKMVLPADLTTGRLKVNEALVPIIGTTYKMSGLEGDYEWGVQAIDNGKQASKFAKLTPNSLTKVSEASVNVIGKKQAIEVTAANDLQGTLNVYAVSGVKIYSKAGQINGSTVTLPAGVYIVKTASTEGTSVNKVIVK